MKNKIAISVGDLNGIGIEIALRAHNIIKEFVDPIYCIDKELLEEAASLLELNIPKDFNIVGNFAPLFKIRPKKIDKNSGLYSFLSFKKAIDIAIEEKFKRVLTLPINKEAWQKASIPYKGHTDALRDIFKKDAIMMLGSSKMYVALYTEHIPLKDVPKYIEKEQLVNFLLNLINSINLEKDEKIAILGLNPHAGDGGVLGDEENIIKEAIKEVNYKIKKEIFIGPLVPDIAFIPSNREKFRYYVALYHDQGLIPLKSLYFDEAINISLNLPILRSSVDHGTAFDIAYKKDKKLNLKSYINAAKYLAS